MDEPTTPTGYHSSTKRKYNSQISCILSQMLISFPSLMQFLTNFPTEGSLTNCDSREESRIKFQKFQRIKKERKINK